MTDRTTCLACGAHLPPGARVDRRYCDRTCNNRHYKAVRRGASPAEPVADASLIVARIPAERLAWVAGIVEGEGSITTHQSKTYRGNTYTYALIKVAMVDKDVISRLHTWTGLGRMTGPHLPPVRANAGHQPQFAWNVNSFPAVDALSAALYPLMSKRRQGQIDRMRQRMAERTLLRG